MSNENLHIEVQNASQNGGIRVSTTNINQAITATNNKAMYYAEQAKKYKDEAKNMRDLAQYYAESNPNGYTSNVGTITGIKMNGTSKGTSGVVDLGTVITSHQSLADYIKSENLGTMAYADSVTNDDISGTINQDKITNLLTTLSGKQDTLVNGVNLKTINSNSLLGSGDITISVGANTDLSNLSAAGENYFVKSTLPQIQASYLKTTYVNGASGYNIWSNGYCEQWGTAVASAGAYQVTVTLLKSYSDTTFTGLSIACAESGTDAGTSTSQRTCFVPVTVNSFNICVTCPWTTRWFTRGYLAEGQY